MQLKSKMMQEMGLLCTKTGLKRLIRKIKLSFLLWYYNGKIGRWLDRRMDDLWWYEYKKNKQH